MPGETNPENTPNSDNGTINAATNGGSDSSTNPASSATPNPNDPLHKRFENARKEGEDRGRRGAIRELNQKAQALGFQNIEDMMNSRTNASKAGSNTQQRNGSNGHGRYQRRREPEPTVSASPRKTREDRIRDRQERRAQAERERQSQAAAEAKAKAEQAERDKERVQAELEQERENNRIQRIAMRAGVEDLEYAVILRNRAVKALPKDEQASFDDKQYFEVTLRKERPTLYEAHVEPVTTGNGQTKTTEGQENKGNGAPPPAPPAGNGNGYPKGKDPNHRFAKLTRADVMKLPKHEYNQYLEWRGLSPDN